MSKQHAEAYCLMKYASDDGHIVEWLWNSRDGVTPFMISAQDGKTLLHHVDFHLDRFLPLYKPLAGERIFISKPFDVAEGQATMRAKITQGSLPYSEKARKEIFDNIYMNGHAPMVIYARDWSAYQ
jgi:hypothetical protein